MDHTPSRQREIVFAFLETAGEPDLMATPAEVSAWLWRARLIPQDMEISQTEFTLARRVRASLFSLLLANSGGGDLDSRVLPSLEAVTEEAPLRFVPGANGALELVPAGDGVARAMAELLGVVHRASVTGDFARWKACRKCSWPFYDSSKNRSRVWCDMQLCGSQEKAKNYRQRHSAAS